MTGCVLSISGPGDESDGRSDASPEGTMPSLPSVSQVGDSAALSLAWVGGDDGWVEVERSWPGCDSTCYATVMRSETQVNAYIDDTVAFSVPYRYKVSNSLGDHGYSDPVTPVDTSTPPASVDWAATPVFADEFNGGTFWADADTSSNGFWHSFTSYGGIGWKEGHNDYTKARLVDREGGVRALAIESQPLARVGTPIDWCRWALGESMLGTVERTQALDRCRVHTAYLRTYAGWQDGVQLGPKFGPGMKFQARVSFAEAIRPGQLFDFWLQVEKPQSIYDEEEDARRLAGAGGVAYDGLAYNGTEIDIFEFGFGHRSWNTAWSGLSDVSRFNTAMHFDRRNPFDAVSNPDGRTGEQQISRMVDTLNQEPLFGNLIHLSEVFGNGLSASFDLTTGWYVFTLEWIDLGEGGSRLDFYLEPDNGEAGEERYRYFTVSDFHTYDTSNDHFLVLSNEVDQNFTGFDDGIWKYIEQAPNEDDHNTPTSTVSVMTAEGEQSFYAYPEDRVLIDWLRVYSQQ